MTEGPNEALSSRNSGAISPKLKDEDDTTVISEDVEVSKIADDAVVGEEDQVPDLFEDRPVFELGEVVELE